MQQTLFQFAIISVLFQSIRGNIGSAYLETKRHLENFNNDGSQDRAYTFLNIHNGTVAEASPNLPRIRRQDGGNNPSAYSVSFTGDNNDFIKTIYSGEGSGVN